MNSFFSIQKQHTYSKLLSKLIVSLSVQKSFIILPNIKISFTLPQKQVKSYQFQGILVSPIYNINIAFKQNKKLSMISQNLLTNQNYQHYHRGHLDFQQILQGIRRKKNFQDSLETANDLYGIKQYNIIHLTPKKVINLYHSICHRVYTNYDEDHQNQWVGYELKIFVWLMICYFNGDLSKSQDIGQQLLQKISRIFHVKNIELIQYQIKLITCNQSQSKKWQKEQQLLLTQIIKPNINQIKWNEIAKNLYFKSEKKYFRNPKQIREHWLNHLDSNICRTQWTLLEDYQIVKSIRENGRKWALIAKLGGGKRTEHMIKNRYYSLMRTQQKRNQSIHDKEKLLKLLQKRLQETLRMEEAKYLQRSNDQNFMSGEDAGDKCQLIQQKLQNRDENQQMEQFAICLQERDIAEIQFFNWSQKENKRNKKEEQIKLLSLIDLEDSQGMFEINQMENLL